jgi:SAM-dependent methyltransferase
MESSSLKKTYASFGLSRSMRQVRHAWQERKSADANMALFLEGLRTHEQRMAQKLGRPISGLRLLEVGPGQGAMRAGYFALSNEVLAIDLDVVPVGFEPGAYLSMLRKNGVGRLLKTLGRKLLVGNSDGAALARAVGTTKLGAPQFLQGDICYAAPEHAAFDVVMSWSAFEHFADPRRALENVILALKPGGVFYISLHLYSANNGHHDIRAFTGGEDDLPLWGHLRQSTRHLIRPSCYLNEWRLGHWRALYGELAPGADEFLEARSQDKERWENLSPDARQELAGYSREELLSVDVIYAWRKPRQ